MKDKILEHNMVIYIKKGITGYFYFEKIIFEKIIFEKIIDEFNFFYYKLFWLLQKICHGLLLSTIINNHYYYQL